MLKWSIKEKTGLKSSKKRLKSSKTGSKSSIPIILSYQLHEDVALPNRFL